RAAAMRDRARPIQMSLGFAQKITNRVGLPVAAAAACFLIATISQPLRTNWGDPSSDGNAMTSGRFFARYGFVATRFTPILDVDPLAARSLRYTHSPPLPDLVNGILQKLFGPLDISGFRIFALILSLGGLFFFHRFTRAIWGPAAASVAVALLASSFLWL